MRVPAPVAAKRITLLGGKEMMRKNPDGAGSETHPKATNSRTREIPAIMMPKTPTHSSDSASASYAVRQRSSVRESAVMKR